ncbi:MAG: hypothetical protein ACOX6V_00735 [Patescibacteria group bacterium]
MQRGISTITIILIIAAVIILGWIFFSESNVLDQREPTGEVTVNNIVDNPESYYGQEVSVVGEVADVRNPRVFVLQGKEDLIDDKIWIITRSPIPDFEERVEGELFESDSPVQVVGTVRRFIVTEVEQEVEFDLDPDIEAEANANRPVIIADRVLILEEVTPPAATPEVTPETVTPEATSDGVLEFE